MQKVFSLTNKYLILLTPLLLYSLLSSITLATSVIGGKLANMLFAILLSILMAAAFISGWFNMIKQIFAGGYDDEPNSLIKEFPSGVGEYFLPSLGVVINICLFGLLMLGLTLYLGTQIIGNIGVEMNALAKAVESAATLRAFIHSLTPEQMVKIGHWNVLMFINIALTYFLLVLYIPTIFYKTKNPFKAFFLSLKDIFSKKIVMTIGVFLIIFVGNFVFSILSAIFAESGFMHFLVTISNFYFITLMAVGLFYYYNVQFVTKPIGQNIDVEI